LIGPFWLADIALVSVNAILMAILVVTYFRNFNKVRSKFVIGLMTFSVLLFLENLVAAYFYFDLAQSYGPPVAAPLLIINILGVLGLSTLAWTTLR
jgi:hypothetical protein